MTKKLLLIALVFTSINLFAADYETSNFGSNLVEMSTPILSNFRVDDSNKNRVYFESNKVITGSNANGFTVSNENITSLTINEGQLTGHYFTLASSLNFWDNNTIRYEGKGSLSWTSVNPSDIKDADGNALEDFTLSYIVNNISEPDAPTYRYVTVNASGGGNGLTEETAWTLEEAMGYAVSKGVTTNSYYHYEGQAQPGQTVWIKAGNYGNRLLSIQLDGTESNPIKFIGYKTNPGDITSNYWDYTTNTQGDYKSTWNPNEMPTLTGNNAFLYEAIQLRSANNVIIRNFQITNYAFGIRANGSFNTNIVLDRINGHTFGGGNDSGGSFMFMQTFQVSGSYPKPFASNTNYKIRECVSVNSDLHAIGVFGEGKNLLEGNKTYMNWTEPAAVQDYHQTVSGHHNIIRNCYAENFNTETRATSHGIGVKGATNLTNTYNLIEKSESINIVEGFFVRNFGCEYNVIKDSYSGNNENSVNYLTRDMTGGVYIWGGANYNIVERVKIEENYYGIVFRDVQGEDYLSDTSIGHDNVIRNCDVNKTRYSVFSSGSVNSLLKDNKIINCTFNDSQELFYQYRTNVQNLEFINCQITDHKVRTVLPQPNGISFANCNFFGNTNNFNVVGNGNTNLDPKYISSNDLRLSDLSPNEVTEGASLQPMVEFDFEKNKRSNPYSIGAYEYGSSVSVNAGIDIEICAGSGTTLNATGVGDFLWSTGEITPSINVNPTVTTIYSVTLTNGGNSVSDEVEVIVTEVPTVDAGEDTSICFGENVTLTATGVGDFLWSTGETTPSIDVSPTDTTIYTVTASNSCPTEATDQIIVTVNPGVNVDAGQDVTMCAGETVTLTATSNGDFLWSTGETTESITVSPTDSTVYSITSTLGECSISDEVEVTVNELPSVSLSPDISICSGESTILTATGLGDFLWSTGETTESITVNPSITTTYTITVGNSCATNVTAEVTVTVNPGVALDAGQDVVMCVGETVTLTATSNSDFLWSTGETTQSIEVSPSTNTIYSVTSTLGDCSKTDEVEVTVNELPSLTLSSDVTLCPGENNSVTLTATGVGDFLWSTGDTTSSITVNPAETTIYVVTASNSCNVEVTKEVTVTVNPAINLSVSEDVSICEGETITLTAEGNGDFLWSTGETSQSITINPSSSTAYSVTATLEDCSESEDVFVVVSEAPSVNLGSDVSICSGESITLTASGTGNFLWSTGQTTASIEVSPTDTTTYSVTASNEFCSTDVSDEIIITVNPNITLNAGEDVSVCRGDSITLTAEGNGDFLWSTGESTQSITITPTEYVTTYTVSSTNGSCSKTDDVKVFVYDIPYVSLGADVTICSGEPIILTANGKGNVLWSTGETTLSIVVNPSTTTAYTVTTYNPVCPSATDEIIVNVNEGITLSVSPDVTICQGDTVTLTATSNGDYLWSTGETASSITVSPSSTRIYSVSSGVGTCSETENIAVTVNHAPTVSAGSDVAICSGESVTLTATGLGDFLWSTGETTSSITVSPSSTITYTVNASNNSCDLTDEDQVTVNVTPQITLDAGSDVSICPNESVILTATGNGNFLWSTGATTASIIVSPSSTMTYTVSSGSGSCSISDTVLVTVNQALSVNAGSDVSICTGESVTLTATGNGNFLWGTGATTSSITVSPSSSTTYTVTSGSGSCSVTDTVLVTVNQAPSVNAGEDVSICTGDSITLTANGTGNFLWSTGETSTSITVNPAVTTTYTVTTSSTNCESSANDEVIVNVNQAPVVTASNDVTIELGQSTILTANGVGDLKWSTGEVGNSITVNPDATETYTVTASVNGGCSGIDVDQVVVEVVDASQDGVITAFVGENITICLQKTIILNASEGDSYLWSTGETKKSIIVNPDQTTIYSVKVYTGEESRTDTTTIFVNDDCESLVEKEILLYPNPSKGVVNIELTGYNNESKISVFNLNGVMVYSEVVDNDSRVNVYQKQIDLSRFAKGVYFVKLGNDGSNKTKKILLN